MPSKINGIINNLRGQVEDTNKMYTGTVAELMNILNIEIKIRKALESTITTLASTSHKANQNVDNLKTNLLSLDASLSLKNGDMLQDLNIANYNINNINCITFTYYDSTGTDVLMIYESTWTRTPTIYAEVAHKTLSNAPDTIKIGIDLKTQNVNNASKIQLYRRRSGDADVAVGAAQSTASLSWVEKLQTITGWKNNDIIVVKLGGTHSSYDSYAKDLRIVGEHKIIATKIPTWT